MASDRLIQRAHSLWRMTQSSLIWFRHPQESRWLLYGVLRGPLIPRQWASVTLIYTRHSELPPISTITHTYNTSVQLVQLNVTMIYPSILIFMPIVHIEDTF